MTLTRQDAAQAHWQCVQEGDLPQFVIYNSPRDYPGQYVVRMWRTIPEVGPTELVKSFDTLREAQDFIPEGLFRMARQPEDDPTILEVWF